MSAPIRPDVPTRPDDDDRARRGRRPRLVVVLTCSLVVLGLVVAGLASRSGTPDPSGGTASAGTDDAGSSDEATAVAGPTPSTIVNTRPDRRGFLYAIGRSLTPAEVETVPQHYGVVVMNQWDTAAVRRIHQLDPSVVVLMYQCLASMRTTDDATHRSGGVFPAQVAAHPQWYALDTGGRRIAWDDWYGHWQLAVWDADYRRAWVANVVADTIAGGWDGVLADNDMSTLSWYTDRLLAGAGSRAATDRRLRTAISGLIDTAGPALNRADKLLVVNVSDGRLFPGRWTAHTRFGGGLEENFAHFGTSTTADWVGTDTADGWLPQTDQMSAPGLSLAITRSAPTDRRTLLYGYASMLVRADEDAYWMPSVEPDGGYRTLATIPEMALPLGRAVAAPSRAADGAWTRRYATAWVAVNPTGSRVSVTPPAGARTAAGAPGGPIRLDPHTAVLLPVG